jgi:hypothetical protein
MKFDNAKDVLQRGIDLRATPLNILTNEMNRLTWRISERAREEAEARANSHLPPSVALIHNAMHDTRPHRQVLKDSKTGFGPLAQSFRMGTKKKANKLNFQVYEDENIDAMDANDESIFAPLHSQSSEFLNSEGSWNELGSRRQINKENEREISVWTSPLGLDNAPEEVRPSSQRHVASVEIFVDEECEMISTEEGSKDNTTAIPSDNEQRLNEGLKSTFKESTESKLSHNPLRNMQPKVNPITQTNEPYQHKSTQSTKPCTESTERRKPLQNGINAINRVPPQEQKPAGGIQKQLNKLLQGNTNQAASSSFSLSLVGKSTSMKTTTSMRKM